MVDEERSEPVTKDKIGDGAESRKTSNFGYALACFFLAVFIAAVPWFFNISLEPLVGHTLNVVIGVVFYGTVALFGFGFTGAFVQAGVKESPELREFLSRLVESPFSTSTDAWKEASNSAIVLGVAAVVYWVGISILGATGLVAVFVKLVVACFTFLGVVVLAFALDGFFIRPILERLTDSEEDMEPLLNRVRKGIVAAGSVVATIATLLQVLQ